MTGAWSLGFSNFLGSTSIQHFSHNSTHSVKLTNKYNLQCNHRSQCRRSLSEVTEEVLVLEVSDSHEGMLQVAVASLCNKDQHVL